MKKNATYRNLWFKRTEPKNKTIIKDQRKNDKKKTPIYLNPQTRLIRHRKAETNLKRKTKIIGIKNHGKSVKNNANLS